MILIRLNNCHNLIVASPLNNDNYQYHLVKTFPSIYSQSDAFTHITSFLHCLILWFLKQHFWRKKKCQNFHAFLRRNGSFVCLQKGGAHKPKDLLCYKI